MSSLQAVALGLVIVFLDVGSGGWDWVADPVGWVLVIMGLSPLKALLPGYPGTAAGAWVCLVVSVLTLPPDSVDTIDPSLGWLFSLPTIAFCFLLCDGLADVTPDSLAVRFRWLRVAFVVVGLLPGLVYWVGWDWFTIPAAVAAVLTNVTLVLTTWAAGDEGEGDEEGFSAERIRRRRAGADDARSDGRSGAQRGAEDAADAPGAAEAKPASSSRRDAAETPQEPEDGGQQKRWSWRREQDEGFSAEAVRRRLRKEREEREAREAREAREGRDG